MFSFYLKFFLKKERVSRNIVHSLKPKRPKRLPSVLSRKHLPVPILVDW